MKSIVASILTIFVMNGLYGQKTTFYYGVDYSIIDNIEKAVYKTEIKGDLEKKYTANFFKLIDDSWIRIRKERVRHANDTVLKIRRSGEKIFAKAIERSFYPTQDGLFHFTDIQNGYIVQEGTASSITPLHKEGVVKTYYLKPNIPKSTSEYKNNKLVTNENWLKNGTKYFNDLHFFVEDEPEYSLGQAHFREHMLKGLRESGIDLSQISDRVVIGWVVMEDGSLAGFHSIAGVFSQLNQTLIQLIQDTPGEWKPAHIAGKPVRFYMQMPFNFIDRTEQFETLEFSTGWVSWD